MSQLVETHIPCPKCTSSDGYCLYDDGHGYCYVCHHYKPKDGSVSLGPPENATYEYHSHRGISKQTFEFYNVVTEFIDGEPKRVFFTYPNKAMQIRDYHEKKFISDGPMSEAGLFGVDKFDAGSSDSITITEGAYDALAIRDTVGNPYAVVAVKSSSSARKEVIRDWDYLNSFRKIILAFDNDEVGQQAARTVASLFDYSKVYHVKFTRHKDANDYLKAGEGHELLAAWKAAKRYAPDNIISTYEEFARSLVQTKESILATYPSEDLTNRLYGLLSGELTLFKGLEGIGKTEIFRWLSFHILKSTNCNIGLMHLEEDNGTTLKGLAGYELKQPVIPPDSSVSSEEVMKAIKELTKGNEGRVYLHSSYDVEDESTILDNIRFMATAAECKVIFLDHISWLATGKEDDDERKRLDRISQKLKLLAKELNISIVIISHVNDDGKTRGSRNITKVSDVVVHMHRDIVSPSESDRNTLWLTVEKGRLGRKTGPTKPLFYDPETTNLREKGEIDEIKVPNF